MMLKATCINFLDGNLHRFSFDNGNYEISNLKVGQLEKYISCACTKNSHRETGTSQNTIAPQKGWSWSALSHLQSTWQLLQKSVTYFCRECDILFNTKIKKAPTTNHFGHLPAIIIHTRFSTGSRRVTRWALFPTGPPDSRTTAQVKMRTNRIALP
jgi:hypothetical protein